MPTRPFVVAVDGPSGSGKSSVSRAVAARFGLEYLDTGAMYRAVCWRCLELGIDLADADAVAEQARALDLHMVTDPGAPAVHLDGRDVSAHLRTTRVSAAVSAVAANPRVRAHLVRLQQAIIAAAERGCVAEGRDITTVVAPDADLRVLLVADPDARLSRRARELHGRDDAAALAATRDQVLRRDAEDSAVAQFHTAADGVVTVDSSALSYEETVEALTRLVQEHAPVPARPQARS